LTEERRRRRYLAVVLFCWENLSRPICLVLGLPLRRQWRDALDPSLEVIEALGAHLTDTTTTDST